MAPILLNQQSLLTNYVIYSIIALWFNLVFDTTEILLKAQLSSIVRIMVNLAFIYGIIAVLSYKAHKLEKEIETLTFKTREQSQKIVSLSQTIKIFRAGFETFKSAVANQIQDYEVKLYYKNGLIKIFMHDRNKRILRFRILEELYMRKQNIESPVIEKLKSFDGLNALYKKSQNQCTQLKEKVQNLQQEIKKAACQMNDQVKLNQSMEKSLEDAQYKFRSIKARFIEKRNMQKANKEETLNVASKINTISKAFSLEIRMKDECISNQQQDIGVLNSKISSLESQVSTLKKECNTLKKDTLLSMVNGSKQSKRVARFSTLTANQQRVNEANKKIESELKSLLKKVNEKDEIITTQAKNIENLMNSLEGTQRNSSSLLKLCKEYRERLDMNNISVQNVTKEHVSDSDESVQEESINLSKISFNSQSSTEGPLSTKSLNTPQTPKGNLRSSKKSLLKKNSMKKDIENCQPTKISSKTRALATRPITRPITRLVKRSTINKVFKSSVRRAIM